MYNKSLIIIVISLRVFIIILIDKVSDIVLIDSIFYFPDFG